MNRAKIHENYKSIWETPPEIFNPLHNLFNFDIDLAANEKNHLLPLWCGPGSKSLPDFFKLDPGNLQDFSCWLNPPFGRQLYDFTRKAAELRQAVRHLVVLLPASIDTAWFWDNVAEKARVYGRRGRIQFRLNGKRPKKSGNTTGSILAVYGRDDKHLYPLGWQTL